MESQFTMRYCPFPYNGDIQATVTENPATVTHWIANVILSYLALPASRQPSYWKLPQGHRKVLYLAVWPEEPDEIPRVLQIVVSCYCLIYHLPIGGSVPDSLRNLLQDRLYEFGGSHVDSALTRLQTYYEVGDNAIRSEQLSDYRYRPTIPREFQLTVPQTYPYRRTTLATLTHTPATVTRWLADVDAYLLSVPEVHSKIVFLTAFPEQPYQRPRVLQILVPKLCLFFDLDHAPRQMPDSLRQFLANRLYTFVGSNVRCDLARLQFYHKVGGNATSIQQGSRASELYRVDWMLSENDIFRYCRQGFLHYQRAFTTAGMNILED